MATSAATPLPARRTDLNGCWVLDKTRGEWSMRKYLETMQVDALAIEAHEKGEVEHDTYHTIEITPPTVKVVKRSRVNNDLVVELELGKERVEYLPPGERPKRSLARSNNAGHLEIQSSLQTMNGKASVTDIKTLGQEENASIMTQELTIVNEQTGNSHKTVRFFVPYTETPPHLVTEAAATGVTAMAVDK